MRRKRFIVKVFFSLLLFFSVAILSGMLITGATARNAAPLLEGLDDFRAFNIDASHLTGADKWEEARYRRLACSFLANGGRFGKEDRYCRTWDFYSLFLPKTVREEYQEAFATALADGKYFPVPKDLSGNAVIRYEDSWGGARSYGGKRRHEGTDLMPSVKERGYFPVVSVSDGVVEKKGWLKLGGYRLGIRAPHGAYYYYAHLERYSESIEEGSKVKAGEIIGYMGDSGYGEPGTVGQFDVHLHFGIYLTIDGKETSINPYFILKSLEGRKTAFGGRETEYRVVKEQSSSVSVRRMDAVICHDGESMI